MAHFQADDVLDIARPLCNDESEISFLFGTADRPFSGKQCVIYAVHLYNGNVCAIRIPVHIKHLPPAAIANYVEVEVNILKHLEARGFSWSPRVLAHDTGSDNPIKFPYMLLSWISGKPLDWTASMPSCKHTRFRVLRQLADIIYELVSCTEEQRVETSASLFLTDLIDRKISRASKGHLQGVNIHDCLSQRALVHKVLCDIQKPSSFALSHEDLAAQNIIVDDDYNIKGIIDWGLSRFLPTQFAIYFPRFLAIEPERVDEPPLKDLADFSRKFLTPSSTLQADRQCFISHLSGSTEAEEQQHSLRWVMRMVLSDPDVDWRHLVFEAAYSKGLHAWMVERSWLIPSLRMQEDQILSDRVRE